MHQPFVYFAESPKEIIEVQKLRYKVFAQEMGAKLPNAIQGLDKDDFDPYCYHIVVKDNEQLIGTTRILTSDKAALVGRFYSESEFNLDNIKKLPGKIMEVGRTCIADQYRSTGLAISLLWKKIAEFMLEQKIDYLIGCASIPLQPVEQLQQTLSVLKHDFLTSEENRVWPKYPFVYNAILNNNTSQKKWPPLLKAYIRLGAKICGDACLDKDFQVADVFILLEREKLAPRYKKHFLKL